MDAGNINLAQMSLEQLIALATVHDAFIRADNQLDQQLVAEAKAAAGATEQEHATMARWRGAKNSNLCLLRECIEGIANPKPETLN